MPIPTPHINAKKEQIAKTVLMPGDPLRAKFIAETFLTDPVLVNNVRGVQGHTGTWKGVPVTVMASGMGIPSIGIYSWELYNFYDVDNIIRIGSAGALQDDLKLRDVVAGMGACTNSSYVKSFGLGDTATFAPIAETFSPPTPSTEPPAAGRTMSGSAWACWLWRWSPPRSMPTPPLPASARCASARSPTTSTAPRTICPPRSARTPSPR